MAIFGLGGALLAFGPAENSRFRSAVERLLLIVGLIFAILEAVQLFFGILVVEQERLGFVSNIGLYNYWSDTGNRELGTETPLGNRLHDC